MAKNVTLYIIDRLDMIEREQKRLAEEKVAELAAQGITTTVEEVQKPSVTSRSVKEIPSGTKNGVNLVFTTKYPVLTDSEEVFLDGILLSPGSNKDYTISGNTITMKYAIESSDDLRVSYEFVITE